MFELISIILAKFLAMFLITSLICLSTHDREDMAKKTNKCIVSALFITAFGFMLL